MKINKKSISILITICLAIALVVVMCPSGASALPTANDTNSSQSADRSATDDSGSDADSADKEKPAGDSDEGKDGDGNTEGVDQQAPDDTSGKDDKDGKEGESAEGSGGDKKDGGDSAANGKKGEDGKDAVTDETEAAKDVPKKGPTRAMKSGTVSGDWIWKVDGSSGNYTLTFEYTGSASPAPTFTIPNNFISGIASALGEINKNNITSIVIPEGCTVIGSSAFQDMDGITTVEIASTVTEIGNTAFGDNNNDTTAPLGCGKLKTVTIKKNASGKSSLRKIGARAFNGCTALTSIATEGDTSLENTELRYIGYGAFMNVAVPEFYIPDSIAKGNGTSDYYIGEYAFSRNSKLKEISLPALFYMQPSTKTYLFAYDPALENVAFRTVAGATVRNYDYTQLPNYIFREDTSLKEIDLSAWEQVTSTTTFTLRSNDFYNNSLPDLTRIILPNKPIQIANNTFQNKTGLTSFEQLVNHNRITTIGDRAFYGTRLVSGDMSDMTALTSIGLEAFKNCEDMTSLVIPANVTTIGSAAFKNCDNLEDVTINATRLTSVSNSNLFHGDDNLKSVTISENTVSLAGNVLASVPDYADLYFQGGTDGHVIQISKATANGGTKPLRDLNGRYYVDPSGVLYKLNDDNTATLAYIPPGTTPAEADKLTSYTVPETITTPGTGGATYTITGVEHYALSHADNLTELTFAKPENIDLKASAFTGWSTASDNMGKTINGKEYIDKEDGWRKVSNICDFPIGPDDPDNPDRAVLVENIQDSVKDNDGKDVLQVIVAMNEKNPEPDKTYDYLTGQKATYTIAISNEDNTVMNKITRVYFSYSDKDYNMGSFPEGEYSIVNPNGSRYPVKVVQTDNPDIYYFEITGIKPGETLAFQNDIFYPCPTSGGGTVKLWTHTLTPEEAAEQDGKVINPKKYMQLDWETNPIKFNYNKTRAQVYNPDKVALQDPIIMTNSAGEAYVSALAYRLTETNQGSSSTTEGLDYIRWVNYEDVITIPDQLYWREEILQAIRDGKWDVETASTYYDYNSNSTISCKAITVKVGGTKYYVAYLGVRNGYGVDNIDNLKVNLTDDNKVRLTWKVSNDSLQGASATREYSAHTFFLKVGDSVLLADLDAVNELIDENPGAALKDLLKVKNETDEVRHYSYSEDQTAASSVQTPIDADYGVQITKAHQSSNGSYSYIYAGRDEFFNITIHNTGILNLKEFGQRVQKKDEQGNPVTDEEGNPVYEYNGVLATDEIGKTSSSQTSIYLYVEPANIERMFADVATLGTGANADRVALGDWLTLTIDKATLCTPGQYQPVDGTDQNNKYTTGGSSNISASADNGARAYQNAKITFTRTTGGIQAVLTGDPGTGSTPSMNGTYLIGSTGNYRSVEAFFNAIGYMPTSGTLYTVKYEVKNSDPDNPFRLKPGQKLVIPIRSSYKTTPMMLTGDQESYYNTSYVSVNNQARINLEVGDSPVSTTVTPRTYHYWQRELYMYKYGYLPGSNTAITQDAQVEDGTVIDAQLYFYNYSGKAYQHMQVTDYMDGPQVALAPVAQNPNLKAPNGDELEQYTVGGITYYVLNQPGTYENVTFGSNSGKNSTQNLKATIVVSETVSGGKRTSLNTFFQWAPYNNWGASSTSSYIYYKVLVDAAKSGLVSHAQPGEVERFRLNNKAWLGDHQGHRLWDTMGVYSRVYSFDKFIVTDKGKKDGSDTGANGELAKYSSIHQGETVTYQVRINNITDAEAVLKGNRIRDTLPLNYGKFNWEQGVNVTNLRYFGPEGMTITHGTGDSQVDIPVNAVGTQNAVSDDHWTITEGGGTQAQQIRWDNDFQVNFPARGSLTILVDLTFPARPVDGASPWDQFVSANAGNVLDNSFYLDGLRSYVEHTLASEGKAVLYKGVWDTGVTTRYVSNPSHQRRITYQSNNSRVAYQNGIADPAHTTYSDYDLKVSTITYYTVIYNGGYDRLYLSDLQDQLPKGFWLQSMCNTTATSTWLDSDGNTTSTDTTASSSHNWTGYGSNYGTASTDTLSEGYNNSNAKLVQIDNSADELDTNKVKYVNARVSSKTTMGADGKQHVTFTIKGNPSSANGSDGVIKYDDVVKKYFLNPGEAVRFGYNVQIDEYAKTENDNEGIATNTITMPYYDYTGTGFSNAAKAGTVQKAKEVTGITPNDGGCTLMTADQVASEYNVDTSVYPGPEYRSMEGVGEGNFMVSSVQVHRAPMLPGLRKSIEGLTTKLTNPSATSIEGSQGSASALYGTTYKGGAKTSDVVNWKLRVFNESTATGHTDDAGGLLDKYTITDTVDAPYAFTGQVFYNMYKAGTANGQRVTGSSQYLFTIGTRKIRKTQEEDTLETSVRFSSGSSLSSSGYRNVRIGDADNDADDDWFQFGTGAKSGRVKLERDADENEILTIQMTGTGYSIPAGYWADFCVHTMFAADEVIISAPKYNDAVLYPVQDYDWKKVVQGSARTKEEYNTSGELVIENDGVQSGASVMLTQGYTTSSWKKITEIGKNSNTGRSDESSNCITLSEKTKKFKYDMYIISAQTVTSKIVVIDDLPHIGDHSAFVDADKRNSEFKVGFLTDNLDLKVAIAKKSGQTETVLTEDKYDVYVTEKTSFTKSDWNGDPNLGDPAEGNWAKLNDPNLTQEQKEALLEKARSIRVVIKDPNAWITSNNASSYLMPSECQIHVSFNAQIDDDKAKPGQIAWNSFGYRYQVPQIQNGTEENSFGISLEAQPLNVGVKYPAAPQLTKKLTEEITETPEPTEDDPDPDPVTRVVPKTADQDLNFRFIVYEGDPIEALNGALSMTDSEIASVLQANNRKYIYLPYEIKEGESQHVLGLWDIDYCSSFNADTGKFETTEVPWTWTDEKKCSLIELNMGEYIYELESVAIGKNTHTGGGEDRVNNLPFTNSGDLTLEISAENRYLPEYVDLKGKKVWDDEDDNDRYRPETITVRLFKDDEEIDQIEVSADDGWMWSFDGLLKKDEDGRVIKYKVKEDAVEEYTTQIPDIDTMSEEAASGELTLEITNTHELEKVDIPCEKIWDDASNQDGIRPESIILHLWNDEGEEVRTATVTAKDEWIYTFEDLPKLRDGEPIEYAVTEEALENYSTSYEGFDVINTHTPEQTSVTVTKFWDDNNNQDNVRPEEVTVHLLADGEDTGQTLVLSPANGMTGSFTELDKNRNGVAIEYTVKEDPVEGYTTRIEGDQEEGYRVINTHEPEKIDLSGSKTWTDENDQDGMRPTTITVRLHADGEEVRTQQVTARNGWKYTFSDLPKYKNGQEIVYRLTEDGIDNYSAEYEGYDINNVYTPNKTSVTVTKAWNDGDDQDRVRPEEITVHLLADGKDTGQTLVLNEENSFTGSFTDLVMKKDGKEIVYTVKEDPIEGYTAEITGDQKEGYEIINTYYPKMVRVPGKKIWEDAGDQAGVRPKYIMIRLWADDEEVQAERVTAEDNWEYFFRYLPKYKDGKEITYRVTEDRVDDYSTTYEGFSVVNTHTPGKTSITVTKVWDDQNDRDGIRPQQVVVHLLADGKDTGRKLALSEENGLTGSFTDLERYHKGGETEIEYTVREDHVKGYKTKITGDPTTGYMITNSHKPKGGADTSDRTPLGLIVAALLLSGAGLIILRSRRRKA